MSRTQIYRFAGVFALLRIFSGSPGEKQHDRHFKLLNI